MATSASGVTVDEFENAFVACLAALTNPDYFNVQASEEIETGVEHTIQHFLDVARRMEHIFLQKMMIFSVQKPEHKILENITELKNELARKEQLFDRFNAKLQTWQTLHEDVPGTFQPPRTAVPPEPLFNMPHMQFPPPPMSPQVVQQGGGPHPHHMMQPPCGPPMRGMLLQSQQMHPQQQMGAAQQAGGLQGPLAYLERTMSNVGMPDPRK